MKKRSKDHTQKQIKKRKRKILYFPSAADVQLLPVFICFIQAVLTVGEKSYSGFTYHFKAQKE